MPIRVNVVKAKDVVKMIRDDSTLCIVGMTLVGACETILKEVESSFLETGKPANLTYLHSAGQCDRIRGNQHLCHEGLVKRIIGSHWGLAPKWMEMISQEKVEAYCLPQGQIAHLYGAMACGQPGEISKIGLGTFIDPRIEGGKMNERTKALPDITEVIHIDGQEYMLYKEIPIDTLFIRGTYCDELGNISTDDEAMKLEILPAVLATKRYGGKVIAQVKQIVETGSIHPKKVVVPGVFVDAVVVAENPLEDHRQTSSWYFDPAFAGDIRVPFSHADALPLNIRKVIGRRALMEMYPGCVINLGTGIPNDVIGSIVAEENVGNEIMITVESGIYGGTQAGGIDFGIGKNLLAMIEHDKQMDYYNGAGVDLTFMGAGEMDREGNVNSTKMGSLCTGAGGFIDITQNAKHVVFCASFTTAGLEVDFSQGKVRIVQEGRQKKLVNKVAQISFNGPIAREKGQKMTYVSERAVFELSKDGPVLTEIADGIDLERDIFAQMEFKPLVSPNLKTIPTSIYDSSTYGLLEHVLGKID